MGFVVTQLAACWARYAVQRALLRTAQEIAKGMEYIHDFDIVHGDLKPGNVLLKTHKVDRRGYIAKVSRECQRSREFATAAT